MLATQIAADKTPGLEKREKESHKAVKRSSSNLKKLFTEALCSTDVKSIFKSKTKPPKTPIDVVRRSTFQLAALD